MEAAASISLGLFFGIIFGLSEGSMLETILASIGTAALLWVGLTRLSGVDQNLRITALFSAAIVSLLGTKAVSHYAWQLRDPGNFISAYTTDEAGFSLKEAKRLYVDTVTRASSAQVIEPEPANSISSNRPLPATS